MASTNTKPNTKPAPAGAQAAGTGGASQEAKLLKYVRDHAQQIVASISFAASRANRWTEMQEHLALANQLSTLAGLGQIQIHDCAERPLAMGAGAGR